MIENEIFRKLIEIKFKYTSCLMQNLPEEMRHKAEELIRTAASEFYEAAGEYFNNGKIKNREAEDEKKVKSVNIE